MNTIKTNRLILQPVSPEDANEIYAILSDSSTMYFFVEGTYTLDQITNIIEEDQHKNFHYAVFLQESNKLIGKLTFHPWFMKDTYEIGWIFNKNYTNQGFCTEATKAMLDYGFKKLHLHRIVATCQPENIASKRICEKLNMRLEGHFKKCIYYKDGIWWDELFYSILEEEYR